MGAALDPDLQRAVSAAIRDVEAKTSAELVVVVRARSGTYRDVHFVVGFAMAIVVLVALLYLPTEFPLWSFALVVVAAFALFASIAALSPLGRALTPSKRREAQVADAAHAAFFAKGVSRTSARTGILVYVSLLERLAKVCVDLGVDVEGMGEVWKGALLAVDEAARDASALPAAIRALGVALAEHHPRAANDANELADDVDATA